MILSLYCHWRAHAEDPAMDTLAAAQLSSVKDFDRLVEARAQKHQHLRGRNNVTSCRSPTREFDTKLIKNELKDKRQLEFLRRRSVSPELCGPKSTSDQKFTKDIVDETSQFKQQNIKWIQIAQLFLNGRENGILANKQQRNCWSKQPAHG